MDPDGEPPSDSDDSGDKQGSDFGLRRSVTMGSVLASPIAIECPNDK